jgi:hypothetical protein
MGVSSVQAESLGEILPISFPPPGRNGLDVQVTPLLIISITYVPLERLVTAIFVFPS